MQLFLCHKCRQVCSEGYFIVDRRDRHSYRFVLSDVIIVFIMPRIIADEKDAPRKTPRKRAIRRIISRDDVSPRKIELVSEASRKAPSNISPKENSKFTSKKSLIIGGVLLSAVIASVLIGTSDSGQINVATVIDERNEKIASGENFDDGSSSGSSTAVPVQNTAPPSVPNGGLHGRGVGTAPAKQLVAESPIATTTATTSIDGTEEVGDVDVVIENEDEEIISDEATAGTETSI